jgi:hypothetical protein
MFVLVFESNDRVSCPTKMNQRYNFNATKGSDYRCCLCQFQWIKYDNIMACLSFM